jgi:hypothetical protein
MDNKMKTNLQDIETVRTAVVLNHYSSLGQFVPNWKARQGKLGQRTSIAHGIPMKYRDEVLAYFRKNGISVKLAYRGPSHPVSGYKRRQSYIHRYMATSFAVYMRGV